MDYRSAGVDIAAGRRFVDRIRPWVARTTRPEVLGDLGGFGGFFRLAGYQDPVLVAGTDGVGTKLKLAQALGIHHTVGIDLVAMCVNDVLTSGAEPLFFLDYVATGHLVSETLELVVQGISEGCVTAGCALLGGETAEMPGFYGPGEYDLAGFCVGAVERSALLAGSHVQPGDVALGLASQGVHSNGYSLVRRIVADGNWDWATRPAELGGASLAEALLTPTQIYVPAVAALRQAGVTIHGMAHITGGGLPENLPRCLGPQQTVVIDWEAWPVPPIFQWLAAAGRVEADEMRQTFNMGIGFVVILPVADLPAAQVCLDALSLASYPLGPVTVAPSADGL